MVSDFHNDYLTNENYKTILGGYKKSPHNIISAVFKGKRNLNQIDKLSKYFLKNKGDNLFIAYEDFDYCTDIKKAIDKLFIYNPIYIGLTWNYENNLGYGALTDGNLKNNGKIVIKEINKNNIYLDLAHLSKKSFYDAIDIGEKILCSHTCFYDICQHKRNIDRQQIKAIIEKNGLIGLTFYKDFLTKNSFCAIEDLYMHIDYFAQNFGVDNLAIGTDFYGCNDYPFGFDDYTFEAVLTEKLLKHNYKPKDIRLILSENLAKLLSDKIKSRNFI